MIFATTLLFATKKSFWRPRHLLEGFLSFGKVSDFGTVQKSVFFLMTFCIVICVKIVSVFLFVLMQIR